MLLPDIIMFILDMIKSVPETNLSILDISKFIIYLVSSKRT